MIPTFKLKYILSQVLLFDLILSLQIQWKPVGKWKPNSSGFRRLNESREYERYEPPPVPAYKPAATKVMEQMIIKNLMKDYDWRLRPQGLNDSWPDGGPVKISVNLYMRSISKVDDVNMEYSTQFTFREEWIDPRLAYADLVRNMSDSAKPKFVILIPDDHAQQIWIPDSFFQNEKTANRHLIDKPNVMIRIYPYGQILYSVRLSMSLSCPMDLANYPLDSQLCLIDMASYAYTTDDIIYQWKEDDPIQMKETVNNSLPSFLLTDIRVGYCSSVTTTGDYSCLRTELYLQRLFSYYMLQLYLPSFMLVVVSWVSFWLDKTSVPARVTLGVTTLLTMTTQASGINAKLPPVSYTKAIDVWIGVCLAFIFGALLEFALVNYASNELVSETYFMSDDRRTKSKVVGPPDELIVHSPVTHYPDSAAFGRKAYEHQNSSEGCESERRRLMKHRRFSVKHFKRWFKMTMADKSKKIDLISRILFPVTFFSFNILYWSFYL